MNYNYKKALYFEEFYPILETIINNDIPNLEEFIFNSITEICRYLGISTEIVRSSGIKKNNELRGENRIIELCQILGATDYINPLGGRELYIKSRFTENKLNLHFIKSNEINYKQYKNDFVPFLSIVDVLMFNSVKEVNQMLNQFELL